MNVGLSYGSNSIWNFGAGFRFTRTDYPFYPRPRSRELGDQGDGKNFDLTAKWIPNGLSTVDIRLSYSDITYDYNTSRDFNGFNGALTWSWRPTGKIQSQLSFVGEPGYASTFYAFEGLPVQIDNSRFARTVRWNVTYLATAKTTFTAGVILTKDYLTQTIFGVTHDGSDLVTVGSLGVSYTPTRNSQLSCNFSYTDRSVSDNAERYNMSYPYNASSVNCSGQIVFQ